MSHNHGPKPPKGKPWTPTVDVVLDDPANRIFHFVSKDIDIGTHNEIAFANEGQPGFEITFRLQNPQGYRFPANKDEALWVTDQPTCVNSTNKLSHWCMFEAMSVDTPGHNLVVRNRNEVPQVFGFAPVIRNVSTGDEWVLDPVGTNENGQTYKFYVADYLATAIGGMIAGALLLLGAQKLLGINPFG